MSAHAELARILGVGEAMLRRLDEVMSTATGRSGVFEKVAAENETAAGRILGALGVGGRDLSVLRVALREAILKHEQELLAFLNKMPGGNEFERATELSKRIAKPGRGFFLKRDRGAAILEARPPEHLLSFLGYRNVPELLAERDVAEVFSALRFLETEAWMHETFEKAYGAFTAADFEERNVEVKVLGPEWRAVAEQFVAKKHHNVSHLKEFGVIFLNPIREDVGGKFLRDFALLLHYFHEITFYSNLFRAYSVGPDFASKLKMLLRGDVPSGQDIREGEWLIVQRYLFKEDPKDARLFLPRVNPESLHWARAERDLTTFRPNGAAWGLSLWHNSDWAAALFGGTPELVSFDLEDNAMTVASFLEGSGEVLAYHEREALWSRLFFEYAGGERAGETLIEEYFEQGIVRFT